MRQYTHITSEEREKLYLMQKNGMKFEAIGKALGRSASSISREYNRNFGKEGLGYLPDTAHKMALDRKAKHGCKIDRHPDLKGQIIDWMTENRFSPEMISGRLKQQGVQVRISHEAIYQFIYSKDGLKLGLYKLLMCRRPRRNQCYGRKTRGNYGIPDRVSIKERPVILANEFGNFEGDLTFFKGNGSINLLTMVERKTGYFMADLNATKDSKTIALKLLQNLIRFPRKHRKSLTLDNGKEFVMHGLVKQVTGTPTYFCRPGSPWEKPYVETTHALLHRFIPKNTAPNLLTREKVQNAVIKVNDLPRKRFNFRTPAEMLAEEKFYQHDALRA